MEYLQTLLFLSVVFLHLVKKNSTAIGLYVIQSTVVALLLVLSWFEHPAPLLSVAIVATIAVKLFVTPYFFINLTRKHKLTFMAGSYFSMPITLCVITALTVFTRAGIFKELTLLNPLGQGSLLLPLGMILISLFLIINRKGALSQMIGVLSLENGIVSFAFFAGLEQSAGLQLGITINILVWVFMATVLASMIVRHYGSLDVSTMKRLTD